MASLSEENVEVLEVISPADISVKRVKSSQEFTDFDKLNFELSAMFSNIDTHWVPFDVEIGQHYVARIAARGNQWCRVLAEDVLAGATKCRVICNLIDYGEKLTVDRRCLKLVHPRYFELPAQVKSVCLANILPASMYTDIETFISDIRECKMWTPAATQYLKTIITGKPNVHVKYMPGSAHNVTMYVGDLCVNDHLIAKQLAVRAKEMVSKQPRKLLTFEESLELEKCMEENADFRLHHHSESLSQHHYGDVMSGKREGLSSHGKSIKHQRQKAEDKSPKGRGRSLLVALERDSNTSVIGNDVSQSSFRLPKTQSLAQQCSPPRPPPSLSVDTGCSPSTSKCLDLVDSFSASDAERNCNHSNIFNDSEGCDPSSWMAKPTLNRFGDGRSTSSDDDLYMTPGQQSSTSLVYEKRLKEDDVSEDSTYKKEESMLKAITYDQSKANALKKQITLFSDLPVTPVFSVVNAKLHARALRHWKTLGGADNCPLPAMQAYCWPILRRGRELVAVTDSFYMEGRDGVSLTYLMALATLLLDKDNYKHLPDGNGPRCLILCASWSKAEQIFFHASNIMGQRDEDCLLVLHGRRETESNLCVSLMNGTDMIISTPSTFLRMLDKNYTNVRRLCHLVIDDADIITKEFPQQLSATMKAVATAISENVARAAPRQLMLFATSWSPLIGVFRDKFMTDAATVITSKIEASLASNVKQLVHYIDNENQRLGTMLRLVEESGSPGIRLVICTHLESDAKIVYQALHAYSREVYVALKSMGDLDRTLELWTQVRSENSYPILVVTDEVLKLLISEDNPVTNAQYVLHFNMPATKKLLGLRLHCLSSNYAKDAEQLMLSSHIIFSSADLPAATTVVRLLEKASSHVPSPVKQLSVRAIETNESGKKKELCSFMKSYGVCRDQLKCTARHLISAHLDTPSKLIPTSGDVEFKVVYVKDAITYYARLIRHRGVDGVLRQVPSNKFNLDLSLQTYFSQAYAKIPIDPATIEPDRLCVYGKAGVYCRARVVHVLSNSSSLFPSTARVHLLDECRILNVKASDLYELPSECSLESFPPELVEIVACKLKPMDHDIEWSSEVTTFISQLLLNEIVCGKIRLCLGNTLWCDPIVKREYLKESKIWVSLWYINLKLLGDVSVGNLATENPKHMELLKDACKGKVVLPAAPSKTDKVSKQNQLIPDSAETIAAADAVAAETRQLDEFEPSHIYFSNVEDPSEMFIIRTDQYDRLRDLEDNLQLTMKSNGKQKLKNKTLRSLCIARYPDEDKRWCRCVIMSCMETKLQLLSIDYGLLFTELISEVSAPPPSLPELKDLPYQAIECYLASVMPVEAEWSVNSGNFLWEKCGQSECLYAQVLEKRPAKYIGETSYGVELIDVSSDTDVYISQELITTGLAAARKLDILQQLNMKHEAEQLDYHHQLIPKLVRLLNVTTNHDRRVLITQCIHQLVQQSSNLKYEMKRDGIVKSLCYLVNTVNLHDDLLYHILDCFAIFTTNHIANCEEMWWERGFNYLHELLDICDDNGILTKVLICFKNLINSNSVRQEVDSLETFTINLVYVARTSTILQNRVLSLHIFNTYVQGEVKRVTLLMKHDIVKVLTDILSVNSDSLIESSCQLISTLVSLNSKQPSTQPWTDTLSTLVNRMFKITADSALCSCAKTLYVMLKNLSGATAMLKSTLLHDKLQRLMNSGLNAQTREACINLLVNIKPDEPPPSEGVSAVQPSSSSPHNAMVRKKQTILLKPICKDQAQPIREKRVPPILWWECSQFLMIHVQIHNASNLTPPPKLNYKQGKLHFECGEFEFKLGPLYEKIVSRRSRRELLASEIKYALYKETPALWSKLMKAGYKKPSYVQPHMDLMVTSSDDESHIDYNQSPFLIKPAPTLKYQTFESITTGVSLRAPPAEEFATSEEEESDEEDERYDETYRSQYDFFNI